MDSSLQYRSFAQKNDQKDASFSSHLRPEAPKRDATECNMVDDSDQISVFGAENYFRERNEQKENKSLSPEVDDVDLHEAAVDRRGAVSAVSRLSSDSSAADGYAHGRNYRARSFHATPTASSEASWNSQTGLLSNPPGSVAVSVGILPAHNQKKRRSVAATKWLLAMKCPCSGKNSVQVEEKLSESRTPKASNPGRHSPGSAGRPSLARNQSVKSQKSSITCDVAEKMENVIPNFRRFSSENYIESKISYHGHHRHHQVVESFKDGTGFAFPVLNQPPAKLQVLKGLPTSTPLEDLPRDSLEVFQPPDEAISGKSMKIQQCAPVSHSASDGNNRPGFPFLVSPMSRITAIDDDAASDASSDLFEIESFSTQATSNTAFRRRDSLDEATTFNARRLGAAGGGARTNGALCYRRSFEEPVTPSVAATECYEPSEASINWSVATAEGFDRASVTNFSISASEFEELAIVRRQESEKNGNSGGGGRDWSEWGNGGWLSCRWEKAVGVGPQPGKGAQDDGCRAAALI